MSTSQAALVPTLACAAIVLGNLGSIHLERDYEHFLLATSYGAAGSLAGAEGGHRQRSCGGMLPFPVLLQVSVWAVTFTIAGMGDASIRSS